MTRRSPYLPAFIVLLLVTSCGTGQENALLLPKVLREVSALAVTAEDKLLMVNDEQAVVYEYDPVSMAVNAKFKLGSPMRGDFEGLAIAAGDTWLVTSDGVLYRAIDENYHAIDTGLSGVCEVEGLHTFEARLLILCKTPYLDEDEDHLKIFAYDPGERVLDPFLSVGYKQLGVKTLNPSAITFRDGKFYILAAKQKSLLVITREGKFDTIVPLPTHPQAEGIAFLSTGELYISDEGGKGGDGMLTAYESLSDIPR